MIKLSKTAKKSELVLLGINDTGYDDYKISSFVFGHGYQPRLQLSRRFMHMRISASYTKLTSNCCSIRMQSYINIDAVRRVCALQSSSFIYIYITKVILHCVNQTFVCSDTPDVQPFTMYVRSI